MHLPYCCHRFHNHTIIITIDIHAIVTTNMNVIVVCDYIFRKLWLLQLAMLVRVIWLAMLMRELLIWAAKICIWSRACASMHHITQLSIDDISRTSSSKVEFNASSNAIVEVIGRKRIHVVRDRYENNIYICIYTEREI